ncbi:MAG: hypothetical protein EA426_18135 [Spirochaetaceae bacterium]|nr:MAG: hypothetical protein EA426_18135 [Spirochaetaceae bacterium]
MKTRSTATKLVVLSLVLVFASTAAFAEEPTLDLAAIKSAFGGFAEGVSDALPLNAAVGLNWSNAHIGQLPRFGVGITAGVTTIPFAPVEAAFNELGIALDDLEDLRDIGVPFPAYTVEARLGGLILPFDVGAKFGYFGDELSDNITGMLGDNIDLEYMLAGFDVRYRLIRETSLLPGVSVGAGYNYLRGSITADGLMGRTELADLEGPLGDMHYLALSDPKVAFNWSSSVIDLKAQASKNVLYFLTPYIGFGASRGLSTAGGGLRAELLYSDDGTDYDPITEAQWDALKDAYAQQGEEFPFEREAGFGFSSAADGWGFRVYGGMSLNLFILKLDVTGMYDFVGENFGATVGARIQF